MPADGDMRELLGFILDHEEQFRNRARIASLYSDFQVQRTTNPDGYAANVAAWENALKDAVGAGIIATDDGEHNIFSLRTGEDLLRALETRDWGRPLALGTVVEEAVSRGSMIPLQVFLTTPKSIYDRSLSLRPWWLITWGLKQLGLARTLPAENTLRQARFVVVSNIEGAANKIMTVMVNRPNRVNRIYSMSMFKKEVEELLKLPFPLTDSDLEILLTHIARDRKALAYNSQVVKLKGTGENAPIITSQDETIASLKTLIADLNMQTTSLAGRVNLLSEKARIAIGQNNRVSALTALRSKKLSESMLMRRSETLARLEEVLGKIEQAADQVAFVRIMEASTLVLRGLNTEAGGIEKVEDIVEGLRDEMTKVDEMGTAINEVGQEGTRIDEGEIDNELEDLEKQDKFEREDRASKQTRARLEELDTAVPLKVDKKLGGQSPMQRMAPSESGSAVSEVATEPLMKDSITSFDRMSLEDHPDTHEDLDNTEGNVGERKATALVEG